MTFAEPLFLFALLLVPAALLLYRLVQRRRSRYVVRFTNVDLLGNLVPRTPAWRRHVPPALYLGAIAALVFALARPSMMLAVPREEATIILTMDVSGSMEATDVSPTRLDAARAAASSSSIACRPASRSGWWRSPPRPGPSSHQRPTGQSSTRRSNDLQAKGGTALGDAIITSLEAAGLDPNNTSGAAASPAPSDASAPDASASPAPSADATPAPSGSAGKEKPIVATVLLSDGANSTGEMEPIPAAEKAAALNVPIYAISLGTADGMVTVPDEFGQMHTVNVPPDTETLAAIAETTGGRSFTAPTAADLDAIYQSLGSKIGYTTEEREVTQWFAAAGLLLVVAGAGLAAHWFNRFP